MWCSASTPNRFSGEGAGIARPSNRALNVFQHSTINRASRPYSFNNHASTLPLPLTSMAPRGSKTNSSFSFS